MIKQFKTDRWPAYCRDCRRPGSRAGSGAAPPPAETIISLAGAATPTLAATKVAVNGPADDAAAAAAAKDAVAAAGRRNSLRQNFGRRRARETKGVECRRCLFVVIVVIVVLVVVITIIVVVTFVVATSAIDVCLNVTTGNLFSRTKERTTIWLFSMSGILI